MKKSLIIGLTTLLAGMPALFAQEAEKIEELQEFALVETVDDPVGIIAERPTSTLFGSDRTIMELPRSISIIEGDMLERYGVVTIREFVAVAAGTFTPNDFGIPGALDIRGTPSDTFFRGFRRVENGGNYATPITATQRVEIVRGPPTPYYGGGKIGGFLNFIPKTARAETTKFIEKPTGKLKFTYGSYDKKQLDIEYGAPVSFGNVIGGYYLFGQFEDSKSFFNGQINRNKLVQVAVDLDLNDVWTVEFGGQFQDTKQVQNPGWNRVTQELIDNGTYITGRPAVEIPDDNNNGQIDENEGIPFDLDKFNFGFGTPDPSPNLALTDVGTITLDRKQVFIDPDDLGKTQNIVLYFDITANISDNWKVKNQLFFDNTDHAKYTSYGFSADYDAQIIENKLTITNQMRSGDSFKATNIFGFAYRYLDVPTSTEAFSGDMQIFDRRDLSVGPTTQDKFASIFSGGRSPNAGEDYKAENKNLGVFFMTDATLWDKVGLVLGVRYDDYEVELQEHFGPNNLEPRQASASDDAITYNASLTYSIDMNNGWTLMPYITRAESTFLEVDQTGAPQGIGAIEGEQWLNDSDLWEGGLKVTGWENKLTAAFDVYQQNRTRVDPISGAVINTRSTGYELEVRFVPNRNWAFTFTGTWQKSVDTPPAGFGTFTVIPPALLGLTCEQACGGRYFTGSGFAGLPNFETDGQPDKIISVYGSYTGELDNGSWGVTLGTSYVAEVFAGRLGRFGGVKLPDYFLTNATAFIEVNHWRLGVRVRNLFDEKFFRSQVIFHDSLVYPSEGTTVDVSLSFGW